MGVIILTIADADSREGEVGSGRLEVGGERDEGAADLLSSQAAGVLIVQIVWSADFLGALLCGRHLVGGTEYMFDPSANLALLAVGFDLGVRQRMVSGCGYGCGF